MRGIIFSLLIIVSFATKGQRSLYDSISELTQIKKRQAIAYANKFGIPVRQELSNGRIKEIQAIENGFPIYYVTHNANAAFTTSVSGLINDSHLGLSLTGKNIVVGVWDGGIALGNHVELVNRTQQFDNATSLSSHSTHVTGTIGAAGINAAARGMANEVSVHNYDWNSAETEMITAASNGLLISNHSWGLSLGWDWNNGWSWNGNPSVSAVEDYKFGLYSGMSATWDQIIYNYPTFLIVNSAGNDRNDSGSGVGAPGDGPLDVIGPIGVSKNVLTVGAVEPLSSKYASPSNVVMSTFSSWGPTDDGRIKPDVVADGVDLLSTTSTSTTGYETMSGTSMAAPNATGSLALWQDLYRKYHPNYMLASTLKGLAIHTAEEAGTNPGPDFKFGWGLLNSERASKLIMQEDGDQYQIIEDELLTGVHFLKDLNLKKDQVVKITVCWTDVPGPAETRAILDPIDLRLVNDLDARVTGDGQTFFPWIVNPASGNASTGDNYKDNVEQLEFTVPNDGVYSLDIFHKGTLSSGKQNFSLIISNSDLDNSLKTLYYRGTSANWEDVSGWSEIKAGTQANRIPDENDIVIFESSSGDQTVIIDNDVTIKNLSMFGDSNHTLDLNGNTLTLQGSLIVKNPNAKIINGTIVLQNTNQFAFIDVSPSAFSDLSINFNGDGSTYSILNDLKLNSLNISSGKIFAKDVSIEVSSVNFLSADPKEFNFENVSFTSLSEFSNSGLNLADNSSNTSLYFNGSDAILNFDGLFNRIDFLGDSSLVQSSVTADTIKFSNHLALKEDVNIGSFFMVQPKSLTLEAGIIIDIDNVVQYEPPVSDIFAIKATSGIGASIQSSINQKICFGQISITDVTVSGESLFVVDPSSSIVNSSGWIVSNCMDVLFSYFDYSNNCAAGVTSFHDSSEGNPTAWEWRLDGEVFSTEQDAEKVFPAKGMYIIELTVFKGEESHTSLNSIEVIKSDINIPSVILSSGKLKTTAFASSYQWYFNGVEIPGETTTSLTNFAEPGEYAIEIFSNSCRMRSAPYVVNVTAIDDFELENSKVFIYPNPAKDQMTIEVPVEMAPVKFILYDFLGRKINQFESQESKFSLLTDSFQDGIYILHIVNSKNQLVRKIFIAK